MYNCFGQLTNDGGVLYIQDGATVYADTNIINKNTAITTNEGNLKTTQHLQNSLSSTLEGNGEYHVQQDWTNTATFTKGTSKVIFNNDSDSNLTSGGDDFHDVEMNKDAGNNLTLLDNTVISNKLDFAADDNKIFIENFNLTMDASSSLIGFDDNEYIITDGTGQLVKNSLLSFIFPIGFDENTYNPIVLTENETADNIGVRCFENVLENGTSGNALTESFIDTSWEITEAVAGGSNLDLECQWADTDELTNFGRNYSGIAFYTESEWETSSYTAAIGGNPYIQSGVGFTQFGVFSVKGDDVLPLDIKVNLSGAYETADAAMRDNIRSAGQIPSIEPFTIAGYQHQGTQGGGEEVIDPTVLSDRGLNSIVDWVLLELRDKNDITTVVHTRAALLQRNGNIVDINGNSLVGFFGVTADDYYIAVRHRNHLAIATQSPITLSNTITISPVDFTLSITPTYGFNAQLTMPDGTTAMISGDANGDGTVNAVDNNSYWRPQNGQPFLYNTSTADFNMDGSVNAIDLNLYWRENNSKVSNF